LTAFLGLSDQLVQVGDDLPLQPLRLLARVGSHDSPFDLAHPTGNLQQGVVVFGHRRRAKFAAEAGAQVLASSQHGPDCHGH
jgi:hypothetical protein